MSTRKQADAATSGASGRASAFSLSGEIDLATGDEVRQELLAHLERTTGEVVIDLRAVTFLDSSGLSALADVVKAARAASREVRLAEARPSVRRLLLLARFDEIVDLAP